MHIFNEMIGQIYKKSYLKSFKPVFIKKVAKKNQPQFHVADKQGYVLAACIEFYFFLCRALKVLSPLVLGFLYFSANSRL